MKGMTYAPYIPRKTLSFDINTAPEMGLFCSYAIDNCKQRKDNGR